MKKLLAILATCFTWDSLAQSYYPFPVDSATWSVEEYSWAWFPNRDGCIARHYGLLGDTILDGNTYSKLYGNNLPENYPYSDTAFNSSTATYVAAIREDMNKKLWLRKVSDSIDILYYDFALNTGDTFCFNYFNASCHQVSEVDSILVNGNYRRQIHFQSIPETWIEGIGSTTGWFEWPLIGTWSWRLLCYKENQSLLYGNNYCNCDTYTGISNGNSLNEIKIYPNPASAVINIHIPSLSSGQYFIHIYTMLGQKIKTIKSDQTTFHIDIADLTNGIYLMEIMDQGNNRTIKKIIKNAP